MGRQVVCGAVVRVWCGTKVHARRWPSTTTSSTHALATTAPARFPSSGHRRAAVGKHWTHPCWPP
jgi:hypothetical protein